MSPQGDLRRALRFRIDDEAYGCAHYMNEGNLEVAAKYAALFDRYRRALDLLESTRRTRTATR